MPEGEHTDRKPAEYKLFDVKVSLERKTATVTLNSSGHGMVMLNNFPFDPAGEQTESELKKLALREAKEILKDAAKAL